VRHPGAVVIAARRPRPVRGVGPDQEAAV